MALSVAYPLLLLAIPAAAAFILYTSRNSLKQAGMKRKIIIGLRIAVLTLLIAGMADIGIRMVTDTVTSVFAADSSDSAAKLREGIEQTLQDTLKGKKPSDKVGLVTFGADAAVEFSASENPVFSVFQTKVNGNFTNIERGLKLASSLIPSGDRKRVVLFTDGVENVGDALKQARLMKQQGIAVDVFPIGAAYGPEVQAREISVPERLRLHEKFEIAVKITSTFKTSGVLKLYTDRQLVSEKKVDLREGENNFAFPAAAEKGGLITYTAVIDADGDTGFKNNSVSTFSSVEDVASILVIQDEDEGGSELIRMLKGDIKVEAVRPENLPQTADGLQKYDAFIISDVSAEKLDERFLNNLEMSIKHQGKGLLVTGGEDSYAPGGYYKTVLEKVLPVNMDIKPKEEMPNLGLVLVIDKSGSMGEGQYGISKVDLAKEAAIRSTEVLSKRDMIGVIAFDSAVQWVVKTQKPDNLKEIQESIGTIRAGGGTQILHPLKEAVESLKNADTRLKHIILLTDGHAEKSGYEPIIEDIAREGITLSTVAVGDMADINLLKALSIGGSGRFYMTDEFTDIPKIFAKETFLAGKTYLNNRTFTPNLKNYSEILKNIDSIPSLDGYVGTTPKNTARVIFASDRDDPVLAVWQYGLGRTAAWTSDARGMWTSAWLSWEQAPRFWKNLVSSLLQQKIAGDYSLDGSLSEGGGTLEFKLPADEDMEGSTVEAVMVSPSGGEENICLEPVSPGLYRGRFRADETGVYIANAAVKKEGETIQNVHSGISIPYSPEYDIPAGDSAGFLKKLALEGGGRVIRDPQELLSGELAPVVSITGITPVLLMLAILLFFLEIAVRRLHISFGRLFEKLQPVLKRIAEQRTAAVKRVAGRVKTLCRSTPAGEGSNASRTGSKPSEAGSKASGTGSITSGAEKIASRTGSLTYGAGDHAPGAESHIDGTENAAGLRAEQQDKAGTSKEAVGEGYTPKADGRKDSKKRPEEKALLTDTAENNSAASASHISFLLEKKRKRERKQQ